MGAAKGLLRGAKMNGNHSTVISTAIPAIKAAKECSVVTKIGLGVISPCRPGKPHIKFIETTGALRMQVRGNNAVQMVWIYTKYPAIAIKEITDKWHKAIRR